MKRVTNLFILFIPLFLGIFVINSVAQTCAPVVTQALNRVSDNCAGLGLNEACYGYTRVDATFMEPVSADYFSLPSDRAELTLLESIRTSPFTPGTEEWGIALMKLRANMPNTAPGQSVLFLLLGDVEVRNTVSAESAAAPAESPLNITAQVNANVRGAPDANAAVVGGLAAGLSLPADGISADGAWLRVTYNRSLAWISRTVIVDQPELTALPTVAADGYMPMQAFYFRTGGIGVPECAEAPSTLVVQGPNDLTVRINANGVNIDISSTIALNTTNDRMEVSVLSGAARVDGVFVPRGFSISAPVDPASGMKTGYWSGVTPIPATTRAAFSSIGLVDASLLHYGITIPTDADIQQSAQSLQPDGASVGDCPGNACNSNGVPGGNPPGPEGNPSGDCPGSSCNSNGVPGGNPPGPEGNPSGDCPGNSCNSNGVPGGNPPGNQGNCNNGNGNGNGC